MAKRYALKPGSKFNFDFIEVAERLIAAGFTQEDLAYAMGVDRSTITHWKHAHPGFKKACAGGRDMAMRRVVAEMYRAACGYEWTRIKKEYGPDKKLKKTIEMTDHEPPNAHLLQFILTNRDPENWKWKKQIDETRTVTHKLDGKIEPERIRQFAQRLLKEYPDRGARKPVVSAEIAQPADKGHGVAESVPGNVPRKAADSVQDPVLDIRPKAKAGVS